MLKITMLAVGKLKERAFVELEKEYLKRLSGLAKFDLQELPEVPYRSENRAADARKKEAEKILARLPNDAFIVVLDERGQALSTNELADKLAPLQASGWPLFFIIGSSSGLDESVKSRADLHLALSRLTFTHNFARVLVEEQIYRALTILAGKTYHK